MAVALVPLVWAGLHVVRSATSYPGGWLSDRLGPGARWLRAGWCSRASLRRSAWLAPAAAVVAFLVLGAVAGLTESAERALVARLAPVRTGRGFGLYHGLTGAAALPAGLAFGWLYQSVGARRALASAVVWRRRCVWLVAHHGSRDSGMRIGFGAALASLCCGAPSRTADAGAQVQIRVGVPGRATYSELHEGLRAGTPAADTVLRVLRLGSPAGSGASRARPSGATAIGTRARRAHPPRRAPERAYADSAARLRERSSGPRARRSPRTRGSRPRTSSPSLQAIVLERRRAVQGDSAVLADILGRLQSKNYDHGDAWVLGRLGAGAKDSLSARFRSADSEEFRVRYLTLLSYSTDPEPDSAPGPGVRGARQLRRAQALRHPRLGRTALDRHPGEHAGAARRAGSGPRARRLRRPRACGTPISISSATTARR